ncbi:MAG TPA: hypothetical protein VN737_04130 [Bryobacteraceae bacterium]|nr:hypothetical protein [Bryobacteraceae bacterium]
MAQTIPLTSAPNQALRVALNINGATVTLNLEISYNSSGGFWVMSVADQNGQPLLSCVPLLTGIWPAANILGPYDYMQIGSAFLINQNGAATDFPDDTNLGSGFILLWDNN